MQPTLGELPNADMQETLVAAEGSVAVISVATVSSGAMLSANAIAVAADNSCPAIDGGAKREYSVTRQMSPTQMRVGGSLDLGAVVGNLAVVAAVGALHFGVTVLLWAVKGYSLCRFLDSAADALAVQGMIYFPSGSLAVFLFLLQGTVLCAFRIARSGEPLRITVGLLALGSAAGLITFLWHKLRKVAEGHYAELRYDDPPLSKCMQWLAGPGAWVDRRHSYTKRYGVLFMKMRQRHPRHFTWQALLAAALGGTSGATRPETWDACGHVRVAMAVQIAVYLAVMLHSRPYVRRRDLHADTAVCVLQMIALGFIAAGFYTRARVGEFFQLGSALFTVALAVLGMKGVADGVALIWQMRSGRLGQLVKQLESESAGEPLRWTAAPLGDLIEMEHPSRRTESPAPAARLPSAPAGIRKASSLLPGSRPVPRRRVSSPGTAPPRRGGTPAIIQLGDIYCSDPVAPATGPRSPRRGSDTFVAAGCGTPRGANVSATALGKGRGTFTAAPASTSPRSRHSSFTKTEGVRSSGRVSPRSGGMLCTSPPQSPAQKLADASSTGDAAASCGGADSGRIVVTARKTAAPSAPPDTSGHRTRRLTQRSPQPHAVTRQGSGSPATGSPGAALQSPRRRSGAAPAHRQRTPTTLANAAPFVERTTTSPLIRQHSAEQGAAMRRHASGAEAHHHVV